MARVSRRDGERLAGLIQLRDQLQQLLKRADGLDEYLLSAQIAQAFDCADRRVGELSGPSPDGDR